MVRLCVCGGRDYFNRKKVGEVLDFVARNRDFILISGAATGADTLALDWAKTNNVRYEKFPADWTQYGRAAGYIRNREMLNHGIDILIAFRGGKGTKNMVDICKAAGVYVVEINDDLTYGVADDENSNIR